MKSAMIIGILVVVLAAGIGVFLYMQSTDSIDDVGVETLEDIQNEKMDKTDTDSADSMEKDETTSAAETTSTTASETTQEENTQTEEENTVSTVEEVKDVTPVRFVGEYTSYSDSAMADASEYGNTVLFFHASWCPTCRALKNNIIDSSGDIPGDLTILEVDYDDSTNLRKKYGVTYQHTLVQVDTDGELITKWSGGNTLDSIVSRVQ